MSKNKINFSFKAVQKRYEYFKSREIEHPLEEDSYIIRLDGKDMTKKFFKKDYVFHMDYYDSMKAVVEKLPDFFPYIVFAYTTTDEISLLINVKKLKTVKWYKKRQEKLLTFISTCVSLLFNQNIETKNSSLHIFDARLIKVNKSEYIDYFKTRQAFSFCSFFDFAESREKKKICKFKRKYTDLEKLLSQDYYKDYPSVCFGYCAYYLNNQWKVETAKNIKNILNNTILKS